MGATVTANANVQINAKSAVMTMVHAWIQQIVPMVPMKMANADVPLNAKMDVLTAVYASARKIVSASAMKTAHASAV